MKFKDDKKSLRFGQLNSIMIQVKNGDGNMAIRLIAATVVLALILTSCSDGTSDKKFYTNGTFKANIDIPLGEYVAIGEGDNDEFMLIIPGKNGTGSKIIRAHAGNWWHIELHGEEQLKIKSNVKVYPIADLPKIDVTKAISKGQYKIGTDIPEGEYKITPAENGVFSVSNKFSGVPLMYMEYKDGNKLTLLAGQYLTIQNGKAEFIKAIEPPTRVTKSAPKPTPTPKPEQIVPTIAESPVPRLTVEEFDFRFLANLNSVADTLGVAGTDDMGTPERRIESDREILIYSIGQGLSMNESISAGAVKEVRLVLTDISRDNLLTTLIAFDAIARSFSDDADINVIHRDLGLDANIITNITKSQSVTLNGIKYVKNFIGNNALILSVSE